jgi:hypothetical protein
MRSSSGFWWLGAVRSSAPVARWAWRPVVVWLVAWCWGGTVVAQVIRYDPYAEFQESPPAVLPDGTLHWGTFFKSAALEQNYRRLWNLGACRGSNKAITVPVERNRVLIDRLLESEFQGVVRHVAGTGAGGVIAFSEDIADPARAPVFFAQLHPSGGTSLGVAGPTRARFLAPGMTIRFRATVDDRGHVTEAPSLIEVVTLPADYVPDAVRPGKRDTIVAQVTRVRPGLVQVHVGSGRLRRVMLTIGDDTEVTVDGTDLELVEPGDAIEVKGRLWDGAGSTGAGTVFVSRVTVRKTAPPDLVEQPASGTVATAGRQAR